MKSEFEESIKALEDQSVDNVGDIRDLEEKNLLDLKVPIGLIKRINKVLETSQVAVPKDMATNPKRDPPVDTIKPQEVLVTGDANSLDKDDNGPPPTQIMQIGGISEMSKQIITDPGPDESLSM